MSHTDEKKEPQEFEAWQRVVMINVLAKKYSSALDRLPKLKQEVEAMAMREPSLGESNKDMAARLEQTLELSASLLAHLDFLPGEIRYSRELEQFVLEMQNGMTMNAINTFCAEYVRKFSEARSRMNWEMRAAEEKAKGEQPKVKMELRRDLPCLFEFIKVAGGSFFKGDTFGDDVEERPVCEVQLDSYYIGKYPVTQRQWQVVMGNNPSHFKHGEKYPVENVSLLDAQQFICRLNTLTGKSYRLPTEVELEYAAAHTGVGVGKEKWSGTSNGTGFRLAITNPSQTLPHPLLPGETHWIMEAYYG